MFDSPQVADAFFTEPSPGRNVITVTTRRGGTTRPTVSQAAVPLQTLVKWRDQLLSGLWPSGVRQPDLASIRSATCIPSPYSARRGAMHILNALITEVNGGH